MRFFSYDTSGPVSVFAEKTMKADITDITGERDCGRGRTTPCTLSPQEGETMANIGSVTLRISGIFLAMAVAGCSGDANWQTSGKIADDSVIATEVKAQLANDPVFRTIRFEVESFRGVVLVSGNVDSRKASKRAVSIVKSVYGVNSVKNSIVVN